MAATVTGEDLKKIEDDLREKYKNDDSSKTEEDLK
jgi:hypothetical protein